MMLIVKPKVRYFNKGEKYKLECTIFSIPIFLWASPILEDIESSSSANIKT